MGIVFTIPGTDFSENGVPLNSIVPIDNNPVLILDSGNYNDSSGVWLDVQTGKSATAPAGSTAPSAVEIQGNMLPYFSGLDINVLSVPISIPEVSQFTFNYTVYNRKQLSSVRYIFDLIQDATRFLGTISYNSYLTPSGPKIFSTSDSWQNLPIPALGANERIIVSISVDRPGESVQVFVNGVSIATLDMTVKPLTGELFLGGPNSLNEAQLLDGYIANFSIYEGYFDSSKALVYFNIMSSVYS